MSIIAAVLLFALGASIAAGMGLVSWSSDDTEKADKKTSQDESTKNGE